jgi:hypothetical protein
LRPDDRRAAPEPLGTRISSRSQSIVRCSKLVKCFGRSSCNQERERQTKCRMLDPDALASQSLDQATHFDILPHKRQTQMLNYRHEFPRTARMLSI